MGPSIKYLVSSPYGDIPVDKNKWHLPLEGDGLKTPYRIYFHSIKDFLAQDEFKPILQCIYKNLGKEIHLKDVNKINIRSEKHGLLYHPASIELILKEEKIKFGLNVAISDTGKYWLKEEFSVLQNLNNRYNLPYLPRVYLFSEKDSMSFLLVDWFEGYHEFHISRDEEGKQRIKLWDFRSGYRYLSQEQCFEIYKQAAKILTLYYDLDDFSHIYPWHHAAGDFVVKVENTKIDVRLTTARRYEPSISFVEKDSSLNPVLALCYYLLDLTIRMRLDKLDGLGEIVWADDICVEATLTGFFEALKLKVKLKHSAGRAEDFTILMQSFTPEELKTIFNPLIDHYRGTEDFPVITLNLNKHIDKFYTTLQTLPLELFQTAFLKLSRGVT